MVELQQNSYEITQKDEMTQKEELNELLTKSMALMSSLIASLKKDITGTVVEPEDFLKLKISDWKKMKHKFKQYL